MRKSVSGVYAAVFTPRTAKGALDEPALRDVLTFLWARGVRGFALNGATGEFCTVSLPELERILAVARETLDGSAELLCGIGAASIHECLAKGQMAIDARVDAMLLPMPYFFPYWQGDLETFCREAARNLPAPILLYDLPQFTSGLAGPTVKTLLEECPNIVGIKDSSGSLDLLRLLTESGRGACRMVGNDSVLAQAIRERVCDGVISGVAGAIPELILGLYGQRESPESAEFQRAAQRLEELIQRVAAFPVPWALKWLAEFRGAPAASFAQPVSKARWQQARELREWFAAWEPSL